MAIRNKTLVIGCGRLGAGVANRASAKGENVICIDQKEASFGRLDDTFSGYKVIGDATDMNTLEEDCYISSCQEVIITTGDDNVNLFLAHVCALIYEVPHVYVRFEDPDKGTLVAGFSRIKAIYPFDLSMNKFASLEADSKDWD